MAGCFNRSKKSIKTGSNLARCIIMDLKKDFLSQTGIYAINSQGEPDIDYINWLEIRVKRITGCCFILLSCIAVILLTLLFCL